MNALGGAALVETLQRVHGGGIHSGHGTHTDDEAAGKVLHGDVGNAVGSTEEQRAADLIHADGQRHLTQVDAVLRLVGVLPATDVRLVGHTLDKQQAGQQHTDLDGHHQIEDDRQQEGAHQHDDVGLRRSLHQMDEGTPLAHIVGHDKEDGGDGGHGDQGGVGHQHHQHQQ